MIESSILLTITTYLFFGGLSFPVQLKNELVVKGETYRLCFELNKSKFDAFGLPIKVDNLYQIYVDMKADETKILDTEFGKFTVYPFKKNIININLESKDKTINGAFFLPKFKEIRYAFDYSPVTFIQEGVRPFYCYCPIRCGTWTYKTDVNFEQIEYHIKVDAKYLKKK